MDHAVVSRALRSEHVHPVPTMPLEHRPSFVRAILATTFLSEVHGSHRLMLVHAELK